MKLLKLIYKKTSNLYIELLEISALTKLVGRMNETHYLRLYLGLCYPFCVIHLEFEEFQPVVRIHNIATNLYIIMHKCFKDITNLRTAQLKTWHIGCTAIFSSRLVKIGSTLLIC